MLEYDTNTRRIKVQISESAYRAIENRAAKMKVSISRCARGVLEDALEKDVKALSLEDQLIVARRVQENIENRMKNRG